jgi:hypothetical protein
LTRLCGSVNFGWMFVYAGIDESGYGPIFGPLVIARTVFTMDTSLHPEDLSDSLWGCLTKAVCRRVSDNKELIAVNDSKLLYNAAIGLRHLERGVLPFLRTIRTYPKNTGDLLKMLAYDTHSLGNDSPWYFDEKNGPAIPFAAKEEELATLAHLLMKTGKTAKIRLDNVCGAVVFEDRFNQLLDTHGNKSRCSWSFVEGHLRYIWENYGEYHPFVVIDRQGGRKYYEELFSAIFPDTISGIVAQEQEFSKYRILGCGREMDIVLKIQSEQYHFPVALASMTAKYIRELLMTRFQTYWKRLAPEVKPTLGYFKDGKRFLTEIEPLITSLNINRDLLIRKR